MTDIQVDMTFEEYKEEFIRVLSSMLKNEDKKELMENIKKIDFEWEYKYAIEDKKSGRSPNLRATIYSRTYCMYMCYPDLD